MGWYPLSDRTDRTDRRRAANPTRVYSGWGYMGWYPLSDRTDRTDRRRAANPRRVYSGWGYMGWYPLSVTNVYHWGKWAKLPKWRNTDRHHWKLWLCVRLRLQRKQLRNSRSVRNGKR